MHPNKIGPLAVGIDPDTAVERVLEQAARAGHECPRRADPLPVPDRAGEAREPTAQTVGGAGEAGGA